MAIFSINGLEVNLVAPLNLEEVVLEHIQRTESGKARIAKHGDSARVLRFQAQTDILTTAEKDDLEDELLASGPATIAGDIFPTSLSAYVWPTQLRAGPLSNQWTWFFEVEEVS